MSATHLRFMGAAAVLAWILAAVPAWADNKCGTAYVEAQKLRKKGAFTMTRQQLLICASSECIDVVKNDCLGWLDEVNAAVPSVVVAAKGADGKETLDVQVTIDGKLSTHELTTTAIELDPGTHVFAFEYAGQPPREETVILLQGQKNKLIEVSFAPKAAPVVAEKSPAANAEPTPALSYVLGGAGIVALGAAGFFWIDAGSKKGDLETSGCSPHCAQGDVDGVKSSRLIGDVALGAGLVLLGAAAYFYFAKPAASPSKAALLDFRVGSGGTQAGVVGRF